MHSSVLWLAYTPDLEAFQQALRAHRGFVGKAFTHWAHLKPMPRSSHPCRLGQKCGVKALSDVTNKLHVPIHLAGIGRRFARGNNISNAERGDNSTNGTPITERLRESRQHCGQARYSPCGRALVMPVQQAACNACQASPK